MEALVPTPGATAGGKDACGAHARAFDGDVEVIGGKNILWSQSSYAPCYYFKKKIQVTENIGTNL
jgi:hypothetical protein